MVQSGYNVATDELSARDIRSTRAGCRKSCHNMTAIDSSSHRSVAHKPRGLHIVRAGQNIFVSSLRSTLTRLNATVNNVGTRERAARGIRGPPGSLRLNLVQNLDRVFLESACWRSTTSIHGLCATQGREHGFEARPCLRTTSKSSSAKAILPRCWQGSCCLRRTVLGRVPASPSLNSCCLRPPNRSWQRCILDGRYSAGVYPPVICLPILAATSGPTTTCHQCFPRDSG